MKKILLIIVAVVFITSSTELHQLFKLPEAFSHFKHHQKDGMGVNLIGFLKLHYLPGHPQDNDDTEDQQLPFKKQEAVYHIDILTSHPFTAANFALIILPAPHNTFHMQGTLSRQSAEIFRPPKV